MGRISTKLSFSVPGSGNSPLVPTSSYSPQPVKPGGTAKEFARAMAESVGKGVFNAAVNEVTKRNGNPNPSGKGNGKSNARRSNNGKPGEVNSGLDSRNSTKISWSTGIKSGLVVNPLQEENSVFTPLFILNGQLFPKFGISDTDFNYADAYLKDFVYPQYIQVLLDQHIKSGQDLTLDKFAQYFDQLIRALELYYCIDSILTYSSNVKNQNAGMVHLRNSFCGYYLFTHCSGRTSCVYVHTP
jgi:hypothetical protein